jgi:hypothetical protein
LRWAPSSRIKPYERKYGRHNPVLGHRIVELCNENQLAQEGTLMKHCVGGYIMACSRAGVRIWSLREQNRSGVWQSRVTIEVRYPHIVQARGRYNADPEEAEMALIREWAEANRLSCDRLKWPD